MGENLKTNNYMKKKNLQDEYKEIAGFGARKTSSFR